MIFLATAVPSGWAQSLDFPIRAWTSASGAQVEASPLRLLNDGRIQLEDRAGRRYLIAVSDLVPSDVEYVRSIAGQLQAAGVPDAAAELERMRMQRAERLGRDAASQEAKRRRREGIKAIKNMAPGESIYFTEGEIVGRTHDPALASRLMQEKAEQKYREAHRRFLQAEEEYQAAKAQIQPQQPAGAAAQKPSVDQQQMDALRVERDNAKAELDKARNVSQSAFPAQ